MVTASPKSTSTHHPATVFRSVKAARHLHYTFESPASLVFACVSSFLLVYVNISAGSNSMFESFNLLRTPEFWLITFQKIVDAFSSWWFLPNKATYGRKFMVSHHVSVPEKSRPSTSATTSDTACDATERCKVLRGLPKRPWAPSRYEQKYGLFKGKKKHKGHLFIIGIHRP